MKKNIIGITLLAVSFFIMFLIFTLQGCSTTGTICQNVPTGQTSVICTLSTKLNTSPEAMSQVLQIANVAALEKSLYTAQQANAFIDQIIMDVEAYKGKTITYAQAVKYLNDKFNILSPQVQAVFIIMNPADLAAKEITIPLSDYDVNLILKHLAKQKALVGFYL